VDTDIITYTGITYLSETGMRIQFSTTGELPAPLVADTDYYLKYVGESTFSIYASYNDMYNDDIVDLTTQGSGTHQVVMGQEISARGIILGGSGYGNVVSGNNIFGHEYTSDKTGIYADENHSSISFNYIENVGHGISATSSYGAHVVGNKIKKTGNGGGIVGDFANNDNYGNHIIANNEIYQSLSNGISFWPGNKLSVNGNNVQYALNHGIAQDSGGNMRDFSVTNNVVSNCGGDGFSFVPGDTYSNTNAIFSNNLSLLNGSQGFDLTSLTNSIVTGNIASGNLSASTTTDASGSVIQHNILD
jgi:hypothetical protein